MMANAGVEVGEGNPYSLLVGVKTDRVSKQISVEFPHKDKGSWAVMVHA